MLNLFILGCVRLGNPDLDFQNLHSDFPIERTLSVISFIESRSDSCDIGFSREFFLNRIAKNKPNYWAKANVLYFCESHQCANVENPFKVSCQYLANRKQDIFRMKTTFISTSWSKRLLTFYNPQPKKTKSTKYGVFKAKILWKNYFIRFISLPTSIQLGKCGVDNKQQKCSSESGKFQVLRYSNKT